MMAARLTSSDFDPEPGGASGGKGGESGVGGVSGGSGGDEGGGGVAGGVGDEGVGDEGVGADGGDAGGEEEGAAPMNGMLTMFSTSMPCKPALAKASVRLSLLAKMPAASVFTACVASLSDVSWMYAVISTDALANVRLTAEASTPVAFARTALIWLCLIGSDS